MPRGAAIGAGLRGPGQDRFPEQAKELGRSMGLYPDEVVLLNHQRTSSAGATRETYVEGDTVRGRIDPVGRIGQGGPMGGIINESSSHMVSFDTAVAVTEEDRLRVQGKDWLITAVRRQTDGVIKRVEVRGA